MADHYTKPQQLQQKPAKFYQHFLYKALIVSIFMFILPLLPPQSAPDFIGSGGWEFLHLVFVGLAVSYGLFSRRRIDEESSSDRKDDTKFDAAQNYVSKFLPVDSVFDDEDVSTKVETWTSQYLRNEAVVVVADEEGDDGGGGGENRNRRFVRMEKPLLLPIRSLKSTESDFESRSRSDEDFRSEADSNSVLRSPIPWRSRSGRIQFDPVTAPSPPPPPPPPPPLVASSQSIRSRNSPKSFGSIPQFSSDEIQAKSAEDFVRRKTIFRSPPPPPPPPPPPVRRRSTSRRPPPPPPPPPPPSVIRRSSSRRPSPSTSDHDQLPPVKSDDQQSRSERSHSFVEFPAAEDERIEKLVVMEEEDDDDSSSEAEEYEERKDRVLEFPLPDGSGEYDGEEDSPPLPPDVDRKADEFIAKFREQIRLQRMESIKRTADQVRKNRAARFWLSDLLMEFLAVHAQGRIQRFLSATVSQLNFVWRPQLAEPSPDRFGALLNTSVQTLLVIFGKALIPFLLPSRTTLLRFSTLVGLFF
ncbi:hypothetical protein LINPERHAP2_LOCUS43145 [Linum perenne]